MFENLPLDNSCRELSSGFFYAYIHLPPETSDIAAAPIGSGSKLAVLVFEIGVVLSIEFILEDKTL